MNPVHPLVLCIPTRNGQGLIGSVLAWREIADRLQRPLHVLVGEGSNIPRSRNAALGLLRQQLGPGPRWIAWWDTDLLIPPQQVPEAVAAIQWAEAQGPGAVLADYPQADRQRTVFFAAADEGGWVHPPPEAPRPAEPYVPVVGGGLGWAYVYMDPGWTFQAGVEGEDVGFWRAYPHPIRWATRLILWHQKTVWLV